ncbi:antibiotic biosynthesis monooxygenase domain family protein [Oleiphilus messinensis]|uniref:Antibiotic biosynthesis monooxygenase domain family protein n=1 Tax=Oleiphilus messinensis TaxID=141451 RepID=A0A1Y0IAC5_9GAMM|nr:antibiotic biosynthesis monooxygenase [Oleiphilus messinensis]ARU57200.1 antibiotic biosynthesis monooxygenase domain family protein [Oleiphilus messinensis]
MYAVIFTAKIKALDSQYSETAQKMRDLAFSKYGCNAFNACTEGDTEIAVSYWQSLEDIQAWKRDIQHIEAQTLGKRQWYSWYKVDIAKIERSYESSNNR